MTWAFRWLECSVDITNAGISRMLLENSHPKIKNTNPRLNKLQTKSQKKHDNQIPNTKKDTTTILEKQNSSPKKSTPPFSPRGKFVAGHFALLGQGKTSWSQTCGDFVAPFFGSRFSMLFRWCWWLVGCWRLVGCFFLGGGRRMCVFVWWTLREMFFFFVRHFLKKFES